MTMTSIMSAGAECRPEPVASVPEGMALQAAASLFRGLGDPSRLAILSHLLLGEHRVVELTEHLGLAQSTVSAHLRCLVDCGLAKSRPVGRASVFSVTCEPEVLAVLRAAEGLLASTGDAVVLCPVYGARAFHDGEHGHE
jgi:DNA-binding transcriptional ArsR family regulator